MKDDVDALVERWAPGPVDVAAVATFARMALLVRTASRAKEEAMRGMGIRPWQGETLYALRRLGEPYAATPSHLAQELAVTQAAMTTRVSGLVEAGLVTRGTDVDDGRRVLVRLSPKGRRVTDAVLSAHAAVQETLCAGLSVSERDALELGVRGLYREACR